jgi:hypothetical protein
MDTDHRRRLMRDLGDAAAAYRQGCGFQGIESLPDEIEQFGDTSYAQHAQVLRRALAGQDHHAVLSELILILAKLEQERG